MKQPAIPLILKESLILEWVFISALLLFFFSDAANKILIYKGADFIRISILVRAVYEFIFITVMMLYINRSRLQFIILFLTWFCVFLLGQIILSVRVNYNYNFIENINIFNKYMFVFIVYYALYRYRFFGERFRRIMNVLEFLFILNSVLIIVGFLFKIDVLATYVKNNSFTYRFGYSGLIPAQNEATLFFFIALSYFYYKYFVLNEITGKWRFYCTLVAALLLGTKGIYIFLSIFFIFHFMKNSTPFQRIIAVFIAVAAVAGIYFLLQTSAMKHWMHYFEWNFEEKGLLSTLLSGRDTFFKLKFLAIMSYWTPVNFFIGGQDQTRFLMEMDFFDAFLFFGLAGIFVLLSLYFKTLFCFNLRRPFLLFFVFSFFLIAFAAGHFFTSALNALYLCLVTLYFQHTDESGKPLINPMVKTSVE